MANIAYVQHISLFLFFLMIPGLIQPYVRNMATTQAQTIVRFEKEMVQYHSPYTQFNISHIVLNLIQVTFMQLKFIVNPM